MGTAKRERQKANRQQRLVEVAREQRSGRRKQRIIRWGAIAVVAIIAIFGLSKLTAKKTTVATAASDTTTTVAPSTTVAAPKGKSITGATPCPKTDGSEERVSKFEQAPPTCIDATKTYTATVETTKGSYTALLDAQNAPKTVNNFVVLARYHYFDATPCHRIIANFMAQCGDPTGSGSGGPGYTVPDELPKSADAYKPGTLAMANSGANTNGSQFFTVFASGKLQPKYSIFGQVTDGLDTTVKALNAVGNPGDGAPTEPVSITKVTITEA